MKSPHDDTRSACEAYAPAAPVSCMLAERVAALSAQPAYSEPAEQIISIETHMSWVFLTDAHAYKLKKPITTPHLDYATIEARRRACELELSLNRRLAPDVYLAVVALTQSADHSLHVGGTGQLVDWLVKMRRLPRQDMLDARIERGRVVHADVQSLAEYLRAFYVHAEAVPFSPTAYCDRIQADIAQKTAALLRPRYELPQAEVRALVNALRRWLAEGQPLLAAGAARVVDAHGDLRPEHVLLGPRPVIIDCLEFDRSLRLLDPWSELAFLALECRRLGASWIGEHLLAAYGQPPAALLRFYSGYHALVRAAVSIWHLDDDGLAKTERFRARARLYLSLGAQQLTAAAPP